MTTFSTAKHFRMPIGKYAGKTLDEIGSSDQGLLYLDHMRGELEHSRGRHQVHAAIATYLDEPMIATDLAQLAKREGV